MACRILSQLFLGRGDGYQGRLPAPAGPLWWDWWNLEQSSVSLITCPERLVAERGELRVNVALVVHGRRATIRCVLGTPKFLVTPPGPICIRVGDHDVDIEPHQ